MPEDKALARFGTHPSERIVVLIDLPQHAGPNKENIMIQSGLYVASMIDAQRTADINRQLERRRIALERGTLTVDRPSAARRITALFARPAARRHTATQRAVRHA
ncbi:hypothetical protein [Microbacterium sp. H1-D42]|uniref:hypothetical protein n=1 Tax=Microbacterium sp. H1-D42 TaxID=2925844 RepID=UPI001F53B2CD|nr:hypothetical protein [Microbacterium sp. H1-D42]UNK71131.1 hypothetical protein MNR00_01405 [Microbacterium sp. H1-D42]